MEDNPIGKRKLLIEQHNQQNTQIEINDSSSFISA